MITEVEIVNHEKSPIWYLKELPAFSEGSKFKFKSGVNIIIGKNGSGKSTLIELIRRYLMINIDRVDQGLFNHAKSMVETPVVGIDEFRLELLDGVNVKADYVRQTFNYSPLKVVDSDGIDSRTPLNLGQIFSSHLMSQGESNLYSLGVLFDNAFGTKKENLFFDYDSFFSDFPERLDYIKRNRIEGKEFTFLIDEPDSSVDIDNIMELFHILNEKKDQVQLIVVIHNPILIYSLSKNPNINFIELTPGYLNHITNRINELI